MRILHYFLGFPPYRTGGLTNFAYDLMKSQTENGDDVSAVWPGAMHVINKKVRIVKKNSVNEINNYEIINPLPVPLDEGIKDISLFTASVDENVYSEFLKKINPDAIHFHTLMGLHKEFVKAAKKLKINTVFTSHDYFGLCPKVTLFNNGKVCDNDNNCNNCVKCNESALSLKKILILQSPLYRCLKDSAPVKYMRKIHRSEFFDTDVINNTNETDTASEISTDHQYKELRKFYIDILSDMSLIHFNSTVSEKIYKKYFFPENSVVLSIANKEIIRNKITEKTKSDKIRFVFLSPAKQFKGYYIVKDVFDRLWKNGLRNFKLDIYTGVNSAPQYMEVHSEGFTRSDLADIFKKTDYLLAPSVWYETFGFTVLEALSYGTPVIVSENVGAKDIIGNNGYVVSNNDLSNELYRVIENILQSNTGIEFDENSMLHNTWKDYVEKNYRLYNEDAKK